MPLTQTKEALTLTVGTASCKVLYFGAHVTSWISQGSKADHSGDLASVATKTTTDGSEPAQERLFMSKKAILDGSAPIRGGIPIAFPVFATDVHPDHPQLGGAHGFARINLWNLTSQSSTPTSESITLTLEPTAENAIVSKYGFDHFQLEYQVTLDERTLSTELVVKNVGNESFRFNSCFHTYYQIPTSLSSATLSPLSGVEYVSRLPQHAQDGAQRDEKEDVVLTEETARCYHLPADKDSSVTITYGPERQGQGVEVTAKGWKDAILWNPGSKPCTGPIGDLHEGGHEEFICWEPGMISELKVLEGGQSWCGTQVMRAL